MSAAPDDRPWTGRRLHFVGIGGAGMSGLALVAAGLGARVTGSDRAESSYLDALREAGVEPAIGHAAEHVPEDAEVVYSTAVPPDNPERAVAAERGQAELHRADLLGEITALRDCIGVTGTHGKTTTSSMVVHALRGCGADPAYLVGGKLRSTGTNAGWGAGHWLVVEADESDRSLLELHPDIAVLTNCELEHHATYGSLRDLEDTFRAFLAGAREAVIWDRPELLALRDAGETVPFDVGSVEVDATGTRFDWRGHPVHLPVIGRHNALNAVAALEACRLAGADEAAAVAALADFEGAARRFERLGDTPAGATVIDDYAHHPTEVEATLEAARALEPRADRRRPAAAHVLAHRRARPRVRRRAGRRGPARRGRRLPLARGRQGLPGRDRAAGRRGDGRRGRRANRRVAAGVRRGRALSGGPPARRRPVPRAGRRRHRRARSATRRRRVAVRPPRQPAGVGEARAGANTSACRRSAAPVDLRAPHAAVRERPSALRAPERAPAAPPRPRAAAPVPAAHGCGSASSSSSRR